MDEKQSRLAAWGLRIAVLALVVLVISIIGLRYHLLAFSIPLKGIAVAGLIALVGLLVSLVGLVVTATGRKAGLVSALVGVVIAAIAATPFSTSFMKARSVPPIHDISTDLINPPQFVAVVPLRVNAPNALDRAAPADLAEQQTKAYPMLAPLKVEAQPGKVFSAARDVVHDMGWTLDAATPETGLIEATATTSLLHFHDDVVIRITATGTGSQVDMRSVSRVGMSDLGTNAARIEAFLAALKTRLAS